MTEWLLAVAVVVCGGIAIAAVWRVTGRLSTVETLDAPGRPEGGTRPETVPPPTPDTGEFPELDDVDRRLWDMIESEYRRSERRALPARAPVALRPSSERRR